MKTVKTNFFFLVMFSLTIFSTATYVNAQAPVITWDDYYPDYEQNVSFQAKDILETPTGSIVILGEKRYASQTNPYNNVLVIRLNKDGYMIWAKEYGGIHLDFIRDTGNVVIDTLETPWTHEVNSMILTPEGNYLITGYRDTTTALSKVYSPPGLLIMELAPSGEVVFDSLYYNFNLTKRMGYDIQPTDYYGFDEGYIVTGMGQNDGTGPDLIMLAGFIRDPEEGYKMAELPYNKPVDIGATGYARWVRSVPDGYLLAGTCYADQDNHIFLMETNKSYTTNWIKKYGGEEDESFSDAVIAGENIYITGSSKVPLGPMSDLLYQIYVIKTDLQGDTIWTRTYGGLSKYYGKAISVAEDGNLMVVATETSSDFLHTYISLLKIDAATGDSLWMQSYGINHFYSCAAGAVAKSSDFGYLIAGRASYTTLQDPRIYVMRLNNSAETMTWAVDRQDINLDIVTGTPTKDVINVSAEVLGLFGVFVKIDSLLHPAVGDLTLTLEHAGTTVTLVDQPIHSGQNFIHTGFIDAAEYPIESGFAPYTGLFQPEEPLFAFMGHLAVRRLDPLHHGSWHRWSEKYDRGPERLEPEPTG